MKKKFEFLIAKTVARNWLARQEPLLRQAHRMKLRAPAMRHYQQAGVTINEYALWAILALVAVGMSFGAYYSNLNGQRPKNEALNIITIYAAAKGARDSYGYSNVNMASLQLDGSIPTNMSGSKAGTVLNGWGGAVTVSGTPDTLTITSAGIPEGQCEKFRAQLDLTATFASISPCNSGGTTDMVLTAH